MTSTEVAIRDQFTVSSPESITAVLAEALEGITANDLDLTRVKVPSGGGISWEIPTGDDDNPEVLQELVGVVIDNYRVDWLYVDEFSGGNEAPDAYWVKGKFVYANDVALEAGVLDGVHCDDQPLNEYGTKGKGRAIQSRWRIFVVRPGELFPLQIDLPPMSKGNFVSYKNKVVLGRKLKQPHEVITSLILKRADSGGGISYSQAHFSLVDVLTEEQTSYFAAQRTAFLPLTRRNYADRNGKETITSSEVVQTVDSPDDIPTNLDALADTIV